HARAEDHPAARDVVERGPLGGEEERISQREGRETAGSEAYAPGARGDGRQEYERFQAGLGEQAVAHPDRVERAPRVRLLGDGEQFVDARRAEQDTAVREAQPVSRPTLHRTARGHAHAGRGRPFVSGAANGVTMTPRM